MESSVLTFVTGSGFSIRRKSEAIAGAVVSGERRNREPSNAGAIELRAWQTVRLHGGRSSAGRASVCGTEGRGFEPRRSPEKVMCAARWGGTHHERIFCSIQRPERVQSRGYIAPLAQRQSNGLLIRRFWVRNPGGAPKKTQVRGHLSGGLFRSWSAGSRALVGMTATNGQITSSLPWASSGAGKPYG